METGTVNFLDEDFVGKSNDVELFPRDREHDLRVPLPPTAKQVAQRLANWRHSHREADFTHDAVCRSDHRHV